MHSLRRTLPLLLICAGCLTSPVGRTGTSGPTAPTTPTLDREPEPKPPPPKPAAAKPTAPKPPAPPPVATAPSGAAFLGLSVADLDATSRWYQDKLQFQRVRAGEAPDHLSRFVLLRRGSNLLELIQHSQAKPPPGEGSTRNAVQVHGLFKAGFMVDDLDAAARDVQARGVTLTYEVMTDRDLQLRLFVVRDNEGNLIQIFGK